MHYWIIFIELKSEKKILKVQRFLKCRYLCMCVCVLNEPSSITTVTQLEIISEIISWPFNRPVSLSEVPDYHDVIKTPSEMVSN